HVIFGLAATKGGLLELGGTDLSVYDDYRDEFYPNRPTISILGPALFIKVFGWREWVFRLNLILVGCLSILVYAGVARRLLQPPWDLVGVYILALMPIFTYFSHIAAHLDYVLLFSLLAWYANLRLEEGPRFRVLLFAALFLACQSDWPGYFALFSIAAHRFRGWKSPLSYALLGCSLPFFALHLAQLRWLGPDERHIKRFLIGGHDRSVLVSPSLPSYLAEEGREIVLYFTAAVVVLAVAGAVACIRERRTTVFYLAFLGLEEVAFTYLAYWHDFLTFPLAPFFATLAAAGAASLWPRPKGRLVVLACAVLAVAQSAWLTLDLHTRTGYYELPWRAALAIREATRPRDRVLLTLGDAKRLNNYYSERHVTSHERQDPKLSIRYSGPTLARIETPTAFAGYVEKEYRNYDVIVAGDPDEAERSGLFREAGVRREDAESMGFVGPEHPLRQTLDRLALSKDVRGAFLFYRMRPERP
ncbi:MAG: glycosyltransferase family 39 protein, partial [Planctomycetaceae bacterium]|nr:glycosyltransferase family 39 protein [Planctomycetaceae bacterium]